MFWIAVLIVLAVGVAVAWWSSGRARPLSESTHSHRRRIDGGGGGSDQFHHH